MAYEVGSNINAGDSVDVSSYFSDYSSGQHSSGSQATGYNSDTYTPVSFDWSSTPIVNWSGGYSTDGGETWTGSGMTQSSYEAPSRQVSSDTPVSTGMVGDSSNQRSRSSAGHTLDIANPTRVMERVVAKTAATPTTDVDTTATIRSRSSSAPSVDVADVIAKPSTKPKLKKSGQLVDTDVDNATDMTETTDQYETKEKKGKAGRPRKTDVSESKMAKAIRDADRQHRDGTRTTRVSPSALEANIEAYAPRLADMERRRQARISDRLSDVESLRNSLEGWVKPSEGEETYFDYLSKRAAERDRILERKDIQASENVVAGRHYGEEEWTMDLPIELPIEDIDNEKRQIEVLAGYQSKRSEADFERMREGENPVDDSLYEDVENNRALEHEDWNDTEESINNKLAEARDATKRMLLNPLLLRIEGEHVVSKKEKVGTGTRLKGHVAYSESVNKAIRNIRQLYGNCSIRDVLELVILRAGLGVDVNQKIGGVDASKFRLSKAQIVELLHDIEASQLQYGHPFGLVQGTPTGSGVRDDSGKFVVVAGTRCYPMGYCPAGLFMNLTSDPSSELYKRYGSDIGAFQRDLGNTWLNDTYPELLRQTSGNAMWQARSIENMMRAVMSMDGIDPSSLRIPEIVVNQSLMQMAVERAGEDPDIGRANEERQRREQVAAEKFLHRNQKKSLRNSDGSRRKERGIEDFFRGLSSFQKAAKVADVFLLVTGPFEALQAMGEANVADFLMRNWTNAMLEKSGVDRREYQVTERLAAVAESRETIEARSVAESLFKIGGWTAVDAFMGDTSYKLTNSDLRRFLEDNLYSAPQRFGAKEGQEAGFLANARAVMDTLESVMLGSDLFKLSESRQFIKLSMNEMAQASLHNRESFTSSDVEQWSDAGGGELVRSLLRTEAGREAFMCQGITSLGRKSPVSHAMRQIMAKNGITEFAVRTFFDRFPEYGMNKIMRQMPFSNTMSYLGSYLIDGTGAMLRMMGGNLETAGQALGRVGDYQAGRRLSFREGLMKNLMYDTIMGANKLIIGCVYFSVIKLLGGLHRPPDDDDRLTWYEWVLGDDENSLPIKWAWFMDDLSGIGLPLGTALAVAESGGWTTEAKREAADVFLNAMADFNDGTALFDAIHLFNNFDEELNDALGRGETWLNPTLDERRQTSLELMAWKFMGDMTPTIVKQALPWSRDFLFREDYFARSASKVWDMPKYTMDEAKSQYRTKSVGDYKEYMYRKEAQNNPIMALMLDISRGAGFMSDNEDRSAKTGYMFVEQPIRTKAADKYLSWFERFQVSPDELSQYASDDAKKEFWRSHAENVCQEINSRYRNSSDAIADGFMLDPETRVACQEYCHYMINVQIPANLEEGKNRYRDEHGLSRDAYIPQEYYDQIVATSQAEKQRYRTMLDNYFENDDIPWRVPRYAVLDSDIATRYVDDNGNAAVQPTMANDVVFNAIRNALGIGSATPATNEEKYLYGNIPNSLPVYSPNRLNPIPDVSNPYPEIRGAERFEPTMPDNFKTYYDPEQASNILGFDASGSSKSSSPNETKSSSKTSGGYGYYGGGSYYRSSGGGGGGYRRSGGGGGSYGSSYNPKIYSSAKQVNGDRASGLQVKQPYKATNTYLRPNFYTKGSREAYKRSDI